MASSRKRPSASRQPAKRAKPVVPKKTKKKAAGRKSEQSTSLLLRDLDPEVAGVLWARAERSGRSLQQELHAALRRDAKRNFDEAAAIAGAWQDRLRGRDLPDTAELIREDRAR